MNNIILNNNNRLRKWKLLLFTVAKLMRLTEIIQIIESFSQFTSTVNVKNLR